MFIVVVVVATAETDVAYEVNIVADDDDSKQCCVGVTDTIIYDSDGQCAVPGVTAATASDGGADGGCV